MADRVEIIKDQWDLFSAHLFMKRNLEMSCEVSRTFIPISFATVSFWVVFMCLCFLELSQYAHKRKPFGSARG